MNRLFKLFKLFIYILLFASISSCTQEEMSTDSVSNKNLSKDIILQARYQAAPHAKSLPFIASIRKQSRGTESSKVTDNFLGYSYSVGNSILGSMENVKFPVLDIDKIRLKSPSNITFKPLNDTYHNSFTYNGMSRYEFKSQVTKTVKTGFKLNLGLFKIGRQKKMTEIFKSSSTYENNRVYGELDLEVRGNQYELLTTTAQRKIYAREYLSPTFLTDLYRGTIGDLLNAYGHFVLRSYITGGKAIAFYSGKNLNGSSSESKEKGLDKDINASYSWKNDSASGSLSFGKNTGSGSTTKFETNETEICIQTFGGNPAYQADVAARKLDELSIDLTSWVNSLSDRYTHTIIDISSGLEEEECGLFPMSDFVLEKNFRYRMDDTTNGFLESLEEVIDPKVEIVKVLARTTTSGEKLYEVAAVLNTRQGDKIVLSDGEYVNATDEELRTNNNNQVMMSKVQNILKHMRTIFQGLTYTTNYATTYNPDVRIPLCIRLKGYNDKNMYLFEDSKSNMRYIYDPTKKIAFSYINDEEEGDYVLDFYGIRDWVENLPKRKISMMMLQNYTIIGL